MKFYTFDNQGFYVEEVDAKNQPKNSTPYEPPEVEETYRCQFDGVGWVIVPNLLDETWGLEDVKQAVYTKEAERISRFNNKYSLEEQRTFDNQYREALDYQETSEIGVYLSSIVELTGEPIETLVDKILAKRRTYDEQAAELGARAQLIRNILDNAKTKSDILNHPSIEL